MARYRMTGQLRTNRRRETTSAADDEVKPKIAAAAANDDDGQDMRNDVSGWYKTVKRLLGTQLQQQHERRIN